MITLIENGEVYAPARRGQQSVLVLDSRIAKIGAIDRRALDDLGVEYDVVDAAGHIVAPGLIDPHEHVLGGSGERGFGTMTPELFVEEIAQSGITAVVGCLGVDVTMKNMPGLIGKTKGLREAGIDAYAWTGGYRIPSSSLMSTVREDILFVEEVIGVGEVAIADQRSMDPDPRELAKVVHDAYQGGMLSRKCGLSHFHVGDHQQRLSLLRELIEHFAVKAEWLYATHVERNERLMSEAMALAARGMHIDIDVVEEDLARWLRFYLDHDGDRQRLTVSSDASISSPRTLFAQLREAVVQHGFAFELVWALASANTARVLGLTEIGTLEVGKAANLVVLERESLDVVHVRCRNAWMVRNGTSVTRSAWLEGNKRELHLVGTQAGGNNGRNWETNHGT